MSLVERPTDNDRGDYDGEISKLVRTGYNA